MDGQGTGSIFYPPHERSETALSKYQTRFNCIKSDYELQGDLDSERSKILTFELELAQPCPGDATDTTNCKTQAEIEEWLKGKFLIVLSN